MIYLLFISGFVLLIKGADWLVEGAVGISRRLGISDLIIGLSVVALGTSLPELIVSVMASGAGNPGLATGNVLGSNIANVLLVIGATALFADLPVKRNTVLSEVPFSLAAALLVGFLANSALWYERADELHLSRGDGLILLFFFFLFLSYVFLIGWEEKQELRIVPGPPQELPSRQKCTLLLLAGMTGIYLGGQWVVEGATFLAKLAGLSDAFIGLTVVAIGTSLPELVTSIQAARKKNMDIAVGNAIGSNIFNLLWILGLSALINPLPFDVTSNVDLLMVITSSCMILLALIIGRRMKIQRIEGVIFLMAYVAYLIFVVYRG